ncbi:MAG: hypothetical protein IJZ37_06835 [Clostridia bacterium]|nr:hypothetical protein [Clostridia bacterium]
MMLEKLKICTACVLLGAALLCGCSSCARLKPPALLGSLPLEEESSYHGQASLSGEHYTASGERESIKLPTPAPSPSPSPSSKVPESSPDQPPEMPDEADREALTDWLWWLTNEDRGENLHMAYSSTSFIGFGRTTIDGKKRFTFSHGVKNSLLNTAISIHDPAYPYVWKVYYRMEEEGFYHVTDATPVDSRNENQRYDFEFSNYEGFHTIDDGFPAAYHLIFIVFTKQGQPLEWFDTVTQWRVEHEQWKAECEA